MNHPSTTPLAPSLTGEESGTQEFVYQKWPDKIFPMVNFVLATMVTLVWGGGGGGSKGRCPTPPTVHGHSNTSLGDGGGQGTVHLNGSAIGGPLRVISQANGSSYVFAVAPVWVKCDQVFGGCSMNGDDEVPCDLQP